jgi:hypothetical protein
VYPTAADLASLVDGFVPEFDPGPVEASPRCPACGAPADSDPSVCPACGGRLRAAGLALHLAAGSVLFRAVPTAEGWRAEGRRADAPRAPWRRLSGVYLDPHACLGAAVGRALRWATRQPSADARGGLDGLLRLDGLAGTLRLAVRPERGGGWRATALPAPADAGWWGRPALAERWEAAGGGALAGVGVDPGRCAAEAVARALTRLEGADPAGR